MRIVVAIISMVDKTPYIEKFKVIYKEVYGVQLTEELAVEYFEQLLKLIMAVYYPDLAMGVYCPSSKHPSLASKV